MRQGGQAPPPPPPRPRSQARQPPWLAVRAVKSAIGLREVLRVGQVRRLHIRDGESSRLRNRCVAAEAAAVRCATCLAAAADGTVGRGGGAMPQPNRPQKERAGPRRGASEVPMVAPSCVRRLPRPVGLMGCRTNALKP